MTYCYHASIILNMREHRISSRGDKEQYLNLRQKLLAEGKSFTQWLEEQIEAELGKKEK